MLSFRRLDLLLRMPSRSGDSYGLIRLVKKLDVNKINTLTIGDWKSYIFQLEAMINKQLWEIKVFTLPTRAEKYHLFS